MECAPLLPPYRKISERMKKLLHYVKTNNLNGIEKMVTKEAKLLTYEYPAPFSDYNIFIIACNDNLLKGVKSDTVEMLIQLGAKCNEPTKNDNWEPLHYTAMNGNKEKMEVIIKYLKPEERNSLVYCRNTYSNNALNVLLKYGHRPNHECCKLLINAGVNQHEKDSNGKSPWDLINFTENLENPQKSETRVISTPFDAIKLNKEEEFLNLKLTDEKANSFDGTEEKFSSCTLLQLCCLKGLKSSVEHLLQNGACPNKVILKNQNCPIMIAIQGDHEDIVKLLLENQNLKLPEDILIKLQIKYKDMNTFTKVDKYMEIIFDHLQRENKESIRNYLMAKDELKRTALHYAVQYKCSENVLELLSMGASLTEKDLFDSTPLDSIEPATLEKFLDSCIVIPQDNEDMSNMVFSLRNQKYKFAVEINYESLIDEDRTESEFLDHMVHSKNLKHLMTHPVVSSYLAVKWQKYKWVIYANLLIYFIAYLTLLLCGVILNKYIRIANILLLTALCLVVIREIIDVIIFRVHYIQRLDNIINLCLIAGIIYIIASGWIETLHNQNRLVAISTVFLTSTLGIFLQLKNLPLFTIKVISLKETAKNFTKYMLFYTFPLLAFFFSFYMLDEEKTDEKGNLFFKTLYMVTVMFAGSFDAAYPEQFTTNPIFGHLIYVVFIGLIGIILQNLLIALAVSDLQKIQTEAEFMDKIERARYITNFENIIFQKYQKTSSRILKRIFKRLLNYCDVFYSCDPVLMIQPYNNGCVFLKDNPYRKEYINDENVLNNLRNIFKNLTAQNKNEQIYSLKMLHEKLQNIENLLLNRNK